MSDLRRQPARRRAEAPARALDAVLFDMDGVVTDTAAAHAAAWRRLFDAFLAPREGQPPFSDDDYRRHVDGRPRLDGVRSFLAARGIDLPEGADTDPPEAETVHGLGARKNLIFKGWLRDNAVRAFPGALALIDRLRGDGVRVAVFTSSRNAEAVLRSAGLADRFDAKVDGRDMAALGLPGKPDPAIIAEAARRLGVAPARAAVVEDALSGVRAGAAGGFAQVIGVDRAGDGAALSGAGAGLVVGDPGDLAHDPPRGLVVRTRAATPSVWDAEGDLAARLKGRRAAVFLDYDGTLSPIVANPADAVLGAAMRAALRRLAARATVAVVSGRDLDDARALVDEPDLHYAGSHGFDLAGPGGWRETAPMGAAFQPGLEAAADDLRAALAPISGAWVERKRFSLAVHWRQAEAEAGAVADAVAAAMARAPDLRASAGKKVFDVKPRVEWDKGRAVLSLLATLRLDGPEVTPIYVGDDTTDEDAFRALADRGIGVVVRGGDAADDRPTAARFAVDGTAEVERLLLWLADRLDGAEAGR